MQGGRLIRRRIIVTGVVQGVGFRPTAVRLARELDLTGFVLNDERGVVVEIQGEREPVEAFPILLPQRLVLPGRIDSLVTTPLPPDPTDREFRILQSRSDGRTGSVIPPDVAICDDCRRELLDPANRRHRYPFITCAQCGPRYTLTESVPFDRERTTMRRFVMCPSCRSEYEDPGDRRFHAQTLSCPECGPHVWLTDRTGRILAEKDAALSRFAEAMRSGRIGAVKGLGGFHLCCDATRPETVAELRKRKGRPAKPLACMARDLSSILPFARVSDSAREILLSHAAPILLLPKTPECDRRLPGIAPRNPALGVMLPVTPLHILLLNHERIADGDGVWVMTSGNRSDEPIVCDNDEALSRLAGVADLFLMHDRAIALREDDSLVRELDAPVVLRRSRGYAPLPILLPAPWNDGPDLLAVGAELKNMPCLLKGPHAIFSRHVGDLETPEAQAGFRQAIEELVSFHSAHPLVCAHDAHPDYTATRWARSSSDRFPHLVPVQHHHAHIVSGMAEHRVTGQVIGVALDGTGYGSDGAIWGGEILLADALDFKRLAHLRPFPLPGGDAATRHPGRTALAALWEAGLRDEAFLSHRLGIPPEEVAFLLAAIRKRFRAPLCSSAGRLFDAMAALLGWTDPVTYEGEAAIALESRASEEARTELLPYALNENEEGPTLLDFLPALKQAAARPPSTDEERIRLADAWISTMAAGLTETVVRMSSVTDCRRIVLTGGVFQNRILTLRLKSLLVRKNLEVYTHALIPPNDGGLAIGQAIIARERMKCAWPFR